MAKKSTPSPADSEPTAPEAAAPTFTELPIEAPVASPEPAPAPEPIAPEAEPRIEVGLESLAVIIAEPAPGLRRWLDLNEDDGRILAADTREGARPMNPRRAKAILAAVRRAFPNAEITLILV